MGTQAVRIVAGTKRFGAHTVLDGIDLSIAEHEFLVILGDSGSGKSTLMRLLAGLDRLSDGTIEWGDDDARGRPHTGIVFQQPMLMPWLTVGDNIEFGGRFGVRRASFDRRYAHDLLTRFGLAGLAERYPDQLSGGQAQRVAIIRAAAIRPRLLLLDEPFSALDPRVRAELRSWLAELAAELDITVVLVTHDVDEAAALADRIVLLAPGGTVDAQWYLDDATDRDDPALRAELLAHFRAPVGDRA